jgi:hypothetical protein
MVYEASYTSSITVYFREPERSVPGEVVSKVPYKCSRGTEENTKDDVCPWDLATNMPTVSSEVLSHSEGDRKKRSSLSAATASSSVCEDLYPWDTASNLPLTLPEPRPSRKNSMQIDSGSSSSDISVAVTEVSDRLKKSCGLEQPCSVGASAVELEKKVRMSSEERIIAKMQTVRKYSTASIVGLGSSES